MTVYHEETVVAALDNITAYLGRLTDAIERMAPPTDALDKLDERIRELENSVAAGSTTRYYMDQRIAALEQRIVAAPRAQQP